MRRIRERASRSLWSDDEGFGLTEVAVAIVVLGIVLVGLFPLVIDSVRLAVKNAEVAQANRIVVTQIDSARRTLGVTCTDPTDPVPWEELTAVPLSEESEESDPEPFIAKVAVNCERDQLARVTVRVWRMVDLDTEAYVATATTNVMTQ